MYYNIELTNNHNIGFIVIIVTIIQSSTRNAAGILVSNSDPDSYLFLSVLRKRKTDYEISSK